jgi:hypothetical protein
MIVLLAIGLAANDAAFLSLFHDRLTQHRRAVERASTRLAVRERPGHRVHGRRPRLSMTNGDLNHQNLTIYEGDATAAPCDHGLETGDHTVTIEYQTTKQGKHAYDFLADDLYPRAGSCGRPVPGARRDGFRRARASPRALWPHPDRPERRRI